jgi:uncharacterized membrane protein HdeD (DUF308 family)
MQTELRIHQLVVGILVVLLILFIFIDLSLYLSLADQRFEVIVSLAVVIAAAAVFAAIGLVEGVVAFQFGPRHKRKLLGYLLLGLASLASGLFLAISERASIQTVALVAAPHAFLFGIGELRLAAHLRRHPVKSRGLLIGGLCEIALGVALVGALYLSSQHAAMLLGCVAILSTVQLVPFLVYKRRSSLLSRNRNSLLRKLHSKNAEVRR